MTPTVLRKNQRSVPRVNGVYDRLRREILSGVIPPGEFLLEEDLAERFEISRTPLREAFIHLYRDGLLQKGPYKGYVVTEVTLATYRPASTRGWTSFRSDQLYTQIGNQQVPRQWVLG
jgi:DNA-binding GntR family transcriptional regulator